MTADGSRRRIAVLHGAGYAGGELVRLLAGHPGLDLVTVTSRSYAGRPVWKAHPALRGQLDLRFSAPDEVEAGQLDGVVVAAEHGLGAAAVEALLDAGLEGAVVDLSADFRFRDPAVYERWYGRPHPSPGLCESFVYGLPELAAPYPDDARLVANPGCFATAITLALLPLRSRLRGRPVAVTALTGASGSGARPSATTHFPTRDGNLRAYKALAHQHLPEVLQALGDDLDVSFVPVSGPWTRGIWGTAQARLAEVATDGAGADLEAEIEARFRETFADAPLVRLWPGELPELRGVVGTPYCDLGWVVQGRDLVVGFAVDNLLKGAATQAVQNLNLLLGLPETAGLVCARRESVR